jgi:hypothetical protein
MVCQKEYRHMNAALTSIRIGTAATTVVRLSAGSVRGSSEAATAVVSEQREPRPIAALLTHVLARYGINDPHLGGEQPRQLDFFA